MITALDTYKLRVYQTRWTPMGPLWFECTRNKNPEVKAEWVIVATVGDREVPHVAHTMLATDYPIGTQVQVEIHTIVKVLKAEEVK